MSVHFHDGELAKLAEYVVDAATGGFKKIYRKGKQNLTLDGKVKKAHRRKLKALEQLANFTINLSEAQIKVLDAAFTVVEDLQETLQDPNLPKREKQRVVDSYTKSVKKYAALVNSTSTTIVADLEHHKGESAAYKMAKASSAADYEAVEMAKGIRESFERAGSNAPKRKNTQPPRKQSQGTVTLDKLPLVLMDLITQHVNTLEA